ncbi:MAG: hypothetical protein LBI67_03675 [Treponema sp.]|nr:hypothetical protein [Treponema sp.]
MKKNSAAYGITLPLVIVMNENMAMTFDLGLKYCLDKFYIEGNLEYYNGRYYSGSWNKL